MKKALLITKTPVVWKGTCSRPVNNTARLSTKAPTKQLPPTDAKPVSLQQQNAGM